MIELTDWMKEELLRRADSEAPSECCGLISAPRQLLRPGTPRFSLWAAENVHETPEIAFEISAKCQFAILRQIASQGEDLVGIYHSHPTTPPDPSPTDRLFAEGWPGLTWVIVGRVPCQCLPVPLQGGIEDNDLIPDGDCELCGDEGLLPAFWIGTL